MLARGEVEAALHAVDRAYEKMLSLPNNGDETYLQAKEDIRLLIADLIHRAYTASAPPGGTPRASWDLGLAVVDNEHVQREIRSFTNGERAQFLEGYRRSGRYRPMMLAKLEAAGLPAQLSWLPLVESWFKERALSRASATACGSSSPRPACATASRATPGSTSGSTRRSQPTRRSATSATCTATSATG